MEIGLEIGQSPRAFTLPLTNRTLSFTPPNAFAGPTLITSVTFPLASLTYPVPPRLILVALYQFLTVATLMDQRNSRDRCRNRNTSSVRLPRQSDPSITNDPRRGCIGEIA